MPWIESHAAIAGHHKTKRLARCLGVTKAAAIGHLHLLWWWALEYALDGNLAGFAAEELADVAEWEGEPEAFTSALISTGFVDETESGPILHDWHTYTERWQRYKSSNAAKQKRYREKRKTELEELRNRNVTSNETVHLTKPNLTNNSNELLPAGKITKIEDARTKELTEGFNQFYAAYPRKVGKATASKSWFALKPNAELRATIMAALAQHKSSHDWRKDDGQYIPHPATWLNQRRWTDELEAARPSNPNRVYGGEGRLAL